MKKLVLFLLLVFATQAFAVTRTIDFASPDANTIVFQGINANDFFGIGSAVFCDANKDYKNNDLLIAAGDADVNGRSGNGVIYLIQNANDRNGTVDLNISSNYKAIFHGAFSSDSLGYDNAITCGDFDGNGYKNDILIGAIGHDYNGRSSSGAVYLVRDIEDKNGIIDLRNANSYTAVFYGAGVNFSVGHAVSLFDANADGEINDALIVGDNNAYLVFDLGTKTGIYDFNIQSNYIASFYRNGGFFDFAGGDGKAIGFGDFDSDGKKDDLIIGSPESDSSGGVYVVYNIAQKTGNIDLNNSINRNVRFFDKSSIGDNSFAIGSVDGNGIFNDVLLTNSQLSSVNGIAYFLKNIQRFSGDVNLSIGTNSDFNIYGEQTSLGLSDDAQVLFIDSVYNGFTNDILIQAPFNHYLERIQPGKAYIISNAETKSGTIKLGDSSTFDAQFAGAHANGFMGFESALAFLKVNNKLHLLFSTYNNDPTRDSGVAYLTMFADANLNTALRPPTTTLSGCDSAWRQSATVTLTCVSNSGSACNSTNYRIDNGIWTLYTSPFSVTTTGMHRIDYYSIDLALNQEDTDYRFCAVDASAPISNSISVSSFTGIGRYTSTATPPLTLSSTDTSSGVSEMSFSCNDSTYSSYVTYATSYSAFNMKTGEGCTNVDGNKTVYVKFKDAVGNISSSVNTGIGSSSFFVDTSAPITTSDANSNWQDFNANIALTCTDTSGSGCSSTKYRTDSDGTSAVSIGAWQDYNGTILVSLDGNWAIDFNSTDNAGNVETTNRQYVLMDRTIPSIPKNLSPVDGNYAGSVTVSCSTQDSNYALRYIIDQNLSGSFQPLSNSISCAFNWDISSISANTKVWFRVRACHPDNNAFCGDYNTSTVATLLNPTTGFSTISSPSPSSNAFITTASAPFSVFCSDSDGVLSSKFIVYKLASGGSTFSRIGDFNGSSPDVNGNGTWAFVYTDIINGDKVFAEINCTDRLGNISATISTAIYTALISIGGTVPTTSGGAQNQIIIRVISPTQVVNLTKGQPRTVTIEIDNLTDLNVSVGISVSPEIIDYTKLPAEIITLSRKEKRQFPVIFTEDQNYFQKVSGQLLFSANQGAQIVRQDFTLQESTGFDFGINVGGIPILLIIIILLIGVFIARGLRKRQ